MIVTRYSPDMQTVWDDFIAASKNGTFLLQRGYMDYHADRFSDHSLLFHNDKGRLLAVMPANRNGDVLASHGGLTYGGIISDAAMTTPLMLELYDGLAAHARAADISSILYKTMPSIYCSLPAEEDRYALFRQDARLSRRDVLAVVDQTKRLGYQERRVRKIKLARKSGLTVTQSTDYAGFWRVLEKALMDRHGVSPVHSRQEIELLAQRFPGNIQLHVCLKDSEILAGVVVYVTPRVAHAQYISASDGGRDLGALDLLFADLLENAYANCSFFDFGISTEQGGRHLNVGLVEQKEGFGARAIVHDHYEVSVP